MERKRKNNGRDKIGTKARISAKDMLDWSLYEDLPTYKGSGDSSGHQTTTPGGNFGWKELL